MEIKKYQNSVNSILNNFLLNEIENKKLNEMVSWSLKGGKRLRSMIVLDVTNSINKINSLNINIDKVAISCELLHTASLIIDDLPCMDNDNYRRNIETIHYKYGTNNAYSISGFLISKVLKLINENINEVRDKLDKENVDKIQNIIINNYLMNYNIAILGQYVDIYPLKMSLENNINFVGQIKEEYLRKIILDKTAPFFEIAFVSSYLICGGNIDNYQELREISQLFGIIFQISDDFEDQKQDLEKSCESLVQNYVIVVGKEKAINDFEKLKKSFINKMVKMNLYSNLFSEIIDYLTERVEKYK
jgi:geranylgeranyl diphosphate synthase type II